MKHYSHIYLLLQRDELAPCNGESKAHYNIVQVLSKIVLSEDWLTKGLYNELWGTMYRKGWGDPWHSPLWPFNYPHDSSPSLWPLHLTMDTWLTLDMNQHYNAHVLMWDNMAWACLTRHHQHSVCCDDTNSLTCLWRWRWWSNANLGHSWWCTCTSWWNLVEPNSCLHYNWCIGSSPSPKSSTSMHMIFISVVEPTTYKCIVSVMIFKCVLVVMHINLPKYMFSYCWTYFLSSPC